MYKQYRETDCASHCVLHSTDSAILLNNLHWKFSLGYIDQLKLFLKLLFLAIICIFTTTASADREYSWGVGGYFGVYYNTNPVYLFTKSDKTKLNDQYLAAVTGYYSLWQAKTLPLSLEIDGMVGGQFGKATLAEVAAVPTIRWEGFPWNEYLHTALRVGPLGVSYTSSVGPYESTNKGGRAFSVSLLSNWFFYSG